MRAAPPPRSRAPRGPAGFPRVWAPHCPEAQGGKTAVLLLSGRGSSRIPIRKEGGASPLTGCVWATCQSSPLGRRGGHLD